MARPRKHAEGLGKPVSFRLPESDRLAWETKVKESGLSPSDFFRDYVLANRTQVVARPQPSRDYDRLLYLFNKAGNNVNQLAHRANAAHVAGTVSEDTYVGILAALDGLTRYMAAALEDV